MSGQQSESSVANFIQKSFQILDNRQFERIIQWAPNGKEFAIKDIEEFESIILPKYFRHNNINSFIRQLNMYGFHKSRKEPSKNIFSHANFLKGHPQLLHLVKRKIKSEEKNEEKKDESLLRIPKQKEDKNDVAELPLKLEEQETAVKPKENNCPVSSKAIIIPSFPSINIVSFRFESDRTPFKSLIEKSFIMDYNPDVYMQMRGMDEEGSDLYDNDDDLLSINGEIEKERKLSKNRMSGITILDTCNFMNDL